MSINKHQKRISPQFIGQLLLFTFVSRQVQSKPVYSNHFFAAENGKINRQLKKTMEINTKCDLFTDQKITLVIKNL